jgi:hypothetical protein
MTEGDIWFDTDDGNKQYYYNGTAWVSVQDTAIAAATSAAAAATAASAAAAAAAVAAQTTADGKNKIYRQTTMPTTGPFSEGDLWFDTDDDNRFYRYTSGAFSAFSLGNNAIASLSATKLTAGTIDASVITVSNINAGNISTGTLAADRILAASITGSKIAANTITAANITAGTITATEIATGTITAAKIATGTITATQIAAGTITATEIAAGTITAAKLATGTLSANNIETGTLSASVGLTAQSGTIGGWNITTTQLYTGTLASPDQYLNASGGALFTGTTTCSALGVNSNLTVGGTFTVGSTSNFNGQMNYAGVATGAGTAMVLVSTGSRVAIVTSSERYKTDIKPINQTGWLDKIASLKPVTFYYDSAYTHPDDAIELSSGFIAEDFAEIEGLETVINRDITGDPFSISYDRFTTFLVLAIKELKAEIDTLKGE